MRLSVEPDADGVRARDGGHHERFHHLVGKSAETPIRYVLRKSALVVSVCLTSTVGPNHGRHRREWRRVTQAHVCTVIHNNSTSTEARRARLSRAYLRAVWFEPSASSSTR